MTVYLIKLKTLLLQNKIFILFFLILSIYVLLYISFFNPKPINNNEVVGYIYDYKIKDNKVTIKIKSNKKIIVNYYSNSFDYEYGDYIKLVGSYKEINVNTNFNMFNYKKYLYSNKIYYEFNASSVKLIKKNNNILFSIKNKIVKRIEKCKSKKYLYVFLLSNKNLLEDNLYSSYKNLGLVHLICISGMHITFIIMFLSKFKVNKYFIYLFLLIYTFILNFSVSILRCFLMYIFKSIRDKYKINISDIKLLFIIMFILLIFNPFYIYNIAFIFSFTISLGLYYSRNKLNTSVSAFLFSIPILINNYFKVNFISLFINIIFIPLISYIIFPFSVLVFAFNSLDKYFYYLTNFMDKMLLKMDEISIFVLSFSKQCIILIIIYYLILVLCIKHRKYFIYLVLIIFIFYMNNYYVIYPRVYFLEITTTYMIQKSNAIFKRNPLISGYFKPFLNFK